MLDDFTKWATEAPTMSAPSYLSTGSTLLNLALSGRHDGGLLAGKYFFFVGDSSSGKTWFALTCLAEASINEAFANHRLIYDNNEDGALMSMERYFGKRLADRLEAPAVDDDGEPLFSETVEDFYYNLDDCLKKGEPIIYIMDSMDGLTSHQELDKFDEEKEAYEKGKTTTGSYGDGKAKKNSQNLRKFIPRLRATNSILLIISQTRDNLRGVGKTRSGGRSLRFYATCEIWTSVAEKIIKQIDKKKRQLGAVTKVQIKKNRQNGQEHTVQVPFYHSFGIDDVGACVDYLVDEGVWTKSGKKINATELNLCNEREALIKAIEDGDLELDLRELVQERWDDIQEKCRVRRKRRYE